MQKIEFFSLGVNLDIGVCVCLEGVGFELGSFNS